MDVGFGRLLQRDNGAGCAAHDGAGECIALHMCREGLRNPSKALRVTGPRNSCSISTFTAPNAHSYGPRISRCHVRADHNPTCFRHKGLFGLCRLEGPPLQGSRAFTPNHQPSGVPLLHVPARHDNLEERAQSQTVWLAATCTAAGPRSAVGHTHLTPLGVLGQIYLLQCAG
jgi:hypothetical protein